MKKISPFNQGFLLLISILIASIVITIAVGLVSVTTRSIALAGAGKGAIQAFYAADAGVDCALFWDLRHPSYDESIFKIKADDAQYTYADPSGGAAPAVSCFNLNFAKTAGWTITSVGGGEFDTTFTFKLDAAQALTSPCVDVLVKKTWTDSNSNSFIDPGEVSTTLRGTGYNTCDVTDPRRFERVLEQSYH